MNSHRLSPPSLRDKFLFGLVIVASIVVLGLRAAYGQVIPPGTPVSGTTNKIAPVIQSPTFSTVNLVIEWDAEPGAASKWQSISVLSTNRIEAPLANWPVLTNLPPTATSVERSYTASTNEMFFIVRAVDFYGKPVFSPVVSVPPQAADGVVVKELRTYIKK